MNNQLLLRILVLLIVVALTAIAVGCANVSGKGTTREDSLLIAKEVLSQYGTIRVLVHEQAILMNYSQHNSKYTVLAQVENLGKSMNNRQENFWVNTYIYPQQNLQSISLEELLKLKPLKDEEAKKLEIKLQQMILRKLDIEVRGRTQI